MQHEPYQARLEEASVMPQEPNASPSAISRSNFTAPTTTTPPVTKTTSGFAPVNFSTPGGCAHTMAMEKVLERMLPPRANQLRDRRRSLASIPAGETAAPSASPAMNGRAGSACKAVLCHVQAVSRAAATDCDVCTSRPSAKVRASFRVTVRAGGASGWR